MKIFAFLLSGFLLLSAGVAARAQDCGFPPALQIVHAGEVDATIVKALEDGQNCLNAKLQDNDYLKIEIYDLQDKLKQTELYLHTAETKTETLEDRLRTAEEAIQVLKLSTRMPARPASNPKATVSKPKAEASKPNGSG